MSFRTVRVNNISLDATEVDIKDFFSFSGDVKHVEMLREEATLPPDSTVAKAEDVVSSMLAKGFILGKDAVNKAKAFDERHHVISNASATVATIDKKMRIREKVIIWTALVNEKVRDVNERFHMSETTKSVLAAAEQKASDASSALMSNQIVSTGASWVSNAFSMVARAAEDVSHMTMEKVERAQEEEKDVVYEERIGVVNDLAHIHLDKTPEAHVVPIDATSDSKQVLPLLSISTAIYVHVNSDGVER